MYVTLIELAFLHMPKPQHRCGEYLGTSAVQARRFSRAYGRSEVRSDAHRSTTLPLVLSLLLLQSLCCFLNQTHSSLQQTLVRPVYHIPELTADIRLGIGTPIACTSHRMQSSRQDMDLGITIADGDCTGNTAARGNHLDHRVSPLHSNLAHAQLCPQPARLRSRSRLPLSTQPR